MKKILLFIIVMSMLGGCTMKPDKEAKTNPSAPLNCSPSSTTVPLVSERSFGEDQETAPSQTLSDNGYFLKVTGNRPFVVDFDNQGNMVMVTAPPTGDGILSRVTPDGKVDKVADLEGIFIGPGMDTDAEGNCYITVGDKLLKVTPDGEVTPLAEGFSKCFDVKLDDRGYLYVADDGQDAIYEISPDLEKKLLYKGKASGSFILTSLAFDQEFQNLYAAEKGCILRFARKTDGTFSEPEFIAKDIRKLFFIGLDANNNLYIDNTEAILRLEEDGTAHELIKSPLLVPLSFKFGGMGFDPSSIYIAVGDGIYQFTCP